MTSPIPTEGGKSPTHIESRLREVADGIRRQGASAIEARELEDAADLIRALLEALTSVDAILNLYPDDAEDIAAALGIENDGALREACAKVRAALAQATGGEDGR